MAKYPYFRKLFLLLGDIMLIVISVWLSVQILDNRLFFRLNTELYYKMLPVNILSICMFFGVYGMYSLAKKRYGEIFLGIVLSVLYTFILVMAASFFLREFAYSRSILMMTAFFEVILLNIWQYIWWRIERGLDKPREALLFGSEEECQRVLKRLKVSPQMNYRVCKTVSTELLAETRKEWLNALEGVDMAIICQDVGLKQKAEIVLHCQQTGKRVMLVPSVYEMYCSGLEIHKIDDIPFFRPQYLSPSLERRSIKQSGNMSTP